MKTVKWRKCRRSWKHSLSNNFWVFGAKHDRPAQTVADHTMRKMLHGSCQVIDSMALWGRLVEVRVNIKKVLLVDDDEYVRRIAAMSLRKLGGFEVQLAGSGAEGLVMAEQLLPDLILLDIVMPGLDGIVTITELKKSPRAKMIPVIFLTGVRELTPPERVRELGALDVIYKPIDPLRLPSQALEIVAASRKR